MTATATATEPTLNGRTRDVLKRAGNPFRNYFARNPDDEVCARYHVPELFSAERDLLHAIIYLYRYDPMTHSEVVPILGNKGAGKTHLLHSIKHGDDGAWQLLVSPGTYQKDTDFLEYLLFQLIDTLLSGGKQKGRRPLDVIQDDLTRRLVTGHERVRHVRAPDRAREDVEIGSADAARLYFDEGLAGSRRRGREVFDAERLVGRVEEGGFHAADPATRTRGRSRPDPARSSRRS